MPTLEVKIPAFNLYIVIDDHGYDVNHFNGIIDLTDKGIGVIQLLQ